jgi:hypothetical protein
MRVRMDPGGLSEVTTAQAISDFNECLFRHVVSPHKGDELCFRITSPGASTGICVSYTLFHIIPGEKVSEIRPKTRARWRSHATRATTFALPL